MLSCFSIKVTNLEKDLVNILFQVDLQAKTTEHWGPSTSHGRSANAAFDAQNSTEQYDSEDHRKQHLVLPQSAAASLRASLLCRDRSARCARSASTATTWQHMTDNQSVKLAALQLLTEGYTQSLVKS